MAQSQTAEATDAQVRNAVPASPNAPALPASPHEALLARLTDVDGISKVRVPDHNTRKVMVRTRDETPNAVFEAMNEAGYDVYNIQSNPTFTTHVLVKEGYDGY